MTQPRKAPMDRMISAADSNEYVNALSHLVGAILSVSALAVLVTLAARAGKWALLVGFAIYGSTLFLSMLASTILHFFLLFGRYRRVLGILDHCAIYLLIAGTYTPFCLGLFGGALGWLMFGIVWSLAAFWIVIKAVFFTRMSSGLSNLSYISMGWVVIVFAVPIWNRLGPGAIGLMVAAGLLYSLGAVSFALERPNPFPPFFGNHEIWHLAVMLGSALFFCVMLFYLLPLA